MRTPVSALPAAERARRNVDCNAAALGLTAPPLPDDVAWSDGLDGSMVARRDGKLVGGTSMPRLVGESVTRDLVSATAARGASLALVAPNTLGHVAAVARQLPTAGSVAAVWPDEASMWLALATDDVSDLLASGRVVPIGGVDAIVPEARRRRGWALPTVVHLPLDTEAVFGNGARDLTELVRAQLQEATRERRQELASRRQTPMLAIGGTLVVAGSGGEAWELAGRALASAVPGDVLDVDDARTASPLALADAAAGARAVIACDVTRGDLPGVLPDNVPVISWIACDRHPVAPVSREDGLLVADAAWRAKWIGAGWREDRVAIAGWPSLVGGDGVGRGVLFAWPERDLAPPPRVAEYSSRAVLWNNIAAELANDPFRLVRLGGSITYLDGRVRSADVDLDADELGAWQRELVTPAFARGLGKLSRRLGATVAAPTSPGELLELASGHAAVIDPTPDGLPAVQGLGLPILSAAEGEDAFKRHVRRAEGRRPASGESIRSAVRRLLTGIRSRRAA